MWERGWDNTITVWSRGVGDFCFREGGHCSPPEERASYLHILPAVWVFTELLGVVFSSSKSPGRVRVCVRTPPSVKDLKLARPDRSLVYSPHTDVLRTPLAGTRHPEAVPGGNCQKDLEGEFCSWRGSRDSLRGYGIVYLDEVWAFADFELCRLDAGATGQRELFHAEMKDQEIHDRVLDHWRTFWGKAYYRKYSCHLYFFICFVILFNLMCLFFYNAY